MMIRRALFVAVANISAMLPLPASAQWIEASAAHYSVFFEEGYESDAAFAQQWLDNAEALAQTKYGVTLDTYHIALYLHPDPTELATIGKATLRCCSVNDGISEGTIDVLTPSSSAWKTPRLLSSLMLPKDDPNYHAKIITSEYITVGHYAVQKARAQGGWRYHSAPRWFTQGLQEYDAIFHSTEFNRSQAGAKLLQWAQTHSTAFSCCAAGVSITDDYNGGATFMAFLAAEFGEGVHARLLRSSDDTFEQALADATTPYSTAELFERFRSWLNTATSPVAMR